MTVGTIEYGFSEDCPGVSAFEFHLEKLQPLVVIVVCLITIVVVIVVVVVVVVVARRYYRCIII